MTHLTTPPINHRWIDDVSNETISSDDSSMVHLMTTLIDIPSEDITNWYVLWWHHQSMTHLTTPPSNDPLIFHRPPDDTIDRLICWQGRPMDHRRPIWWHHESLIRLMTRRIDGSFDDNTDRCPIWRYQKLIIPLMTPWIEDPSHNTTNQWPI